MDKNMNEAIKWESLTKEQQEAFTMYGNVKMVPWHFNDLNNTVDERLFTKDVVDSYLNKIKYRVLGESYGITDKWLYDLLDKYPIEGKTVAVMGSIKPWYEAIVLHYKGIPTAIEWNVIKPADDRLKMIHVKDFVHHPPFDVAFSISTFEHDGLGRYGDPINPDGDLRAMKEMKQIIKKDGLLFLAVPIGQDAVVWNAHRRYGPIRLPYLVDGWEMIDQEGFEESTYDTDRGQDGSYQPVFVLKNI